MRIGGVGIVALLVGCPRDEDPVDTGSVLDVGNVFPDADVGVDAALPAVSAGGTILAVVGLGDLDGDGKAEVAVQLADHVEVWRGADLVAGNADEPWLTFTGATGVAPAGDLDADGKDDVLAGDDAAWRYFRGADLAGGAVAAGDAHATFTAGEGRRFRIMSGGSDVDGDGVIDVVGSQYLPNDNGRAREEVYVLSGVDVRAGG